MFLNLWRRMMKQHSRPSPLGYRVNGLKNRDFKPRLEVLEDRTLLSVWTGASGIDLNWSTAGNWSDGVPGPGDMATFNSDSPSSVVDPAFGGTVGGLDISSWGGSLAVNRNLTTANNSSWTSGTIDVSSGFAWTNYGTVRLNPGGEYLHGALNNYNAIYQVNNWLTIDHNSTLTNESAGHYEFQGLDDRIYGDDITGGAPKFVNQGTVLSNSDSSLLVPWEVDNYGTIQVDSGTLTVGYNKLKNDGGTFQVGDGNLDLEGYDFNLTLSGVFTGSRTGTGHVQFFASTLHAEGVIFNFNPDVFQWRGGTIDGGTDGLINNGSIELASGFPHLSGNLYNMGTILNTGSWLYMAHDSLLSNTGTYKFLGDDVRIYADPGTGDGSKFVNLGTIRNSNGASSLFVPWEVDNLGTIQVDSGTLSVGYNKLKNDGGTFQVGDGNLDLEGYDFNLTLSGVFTGSRTGTGHVQFFASTLHAEGVIFNFNPDVFQWRGGTIDGGTGGLTNRGAIDLASGGEYLQGALYNFGTIHQMNNWLTIDHNSTLTNEGGGTYEFKGDDDRIYDNPVGDGVSTFDNQGTLLKSRGANSLIAPLVFYNTGTVDVNTGTLSTTPAAGSSFTNAGYLLIEAGGRFQVNGDYTQLGSNTLEVQLGDLDHYGQLMVTGVATLGGTLQVDLVNPDYVPNPGDFFKILTYGSVARDFDNVYNPDGSMWDVSTGKVSF